MQQHKQDTLYVQRYKKQLKMYFYTTKNIFCSHYPR